MKPSQIATMLSKLIEARLPVMLKGAPGVGKSDIVAQAAESARADLLISHPVVADPTDAKGLPWPSADKKSATFLPFGDLALAIAARRPLVWFLDDLGQAPPAVQASFMQLLLARRVNGHALPDCVTFVAATNRRTDRAGVSGILEPVKSRFATILEIEPELDDWCAWAVTHDMPPEMIAFLRFRPELLHKFEPTADLTNSPCPRSWSYCGKLVRLGLPGDIEFAAYAGSVGEGAAGELMAFLKTFRELPNLDAILVDPKNASIPSSPSALYAVAAGLAHRASKQNFGRVLTYADRMLKDGKAEFAVLTIRDAVRRDKALCATQDFVKLMSSDFGKVIMGNV